jgi:flagellum-specific peptidoglycan hydrolase FlgJ
MTQQIIAIFSHRTEIAQTVKHAIGVAVFMILGSLAITLAGADRVIFGFAIMSFVVSLLWATHLFKNLDLTSLSNEDRLNLGMIVCLITSLSLLLVFIGVKAVDAIRQPVIEVNNDLGTKQKQTTNKLESPSTSAADIEAAKNYAKAAATLVMAKFSENNNEEALAKAKSDSAYIQRILPVAIAEADKFGIPPAITVAQALLESNGGKSKLATEYNCHFGIKEFRRGYKGAKVASLEGKKLDHSEVSAFRQYSSLWESFRDHSLFLQRPRYKRCKAFKRGQWKEYAYALEACGYAGDEKYAEKLISLIRQWHLDDIDSI